jgi:hypothetical protein
MEGWKSYEEVAAYLLNHFAKEFGLTRVEGKQTVHGLRSEADWEIDAKGVCEGANQGFIIIECRRYTTSKQNQGKLGSLAYEIIDTGASGGIIVSPLGLQEGAEKIAARENVIDVQLDANCTPDEFALKFLNKLMIGIKETAKLGDTPIQEAYRNCRMCGRSFKLANSETVCPDCQGKD